MLQREHGAYHNQKNETEDSNKYVTNYVFLLISFGLAYFIFYLVSELEITTELEPYSRLSHAYPAIPKKNPLIRFKMSFFPK